MLEGKRTYIVAVALAIVTVIHSLGYISSETYTTLMGLLNGAGAATLAAKINRQEN